AVWPRVVRGRDGVHDTAAGHYPVAGQGFAAASGRRRRLEGQTVAGLLRGWHRIDVRRAVRRAGVLRRRRPDLARAGSAYLARARASGNMKRLAVALGVPAAAV